MLPAPTQQAVNHMLIISTLTRLRQEWQEATDGVSLLETSGNIGLVLADLINGFGLNAEDQCRILGTRLYHELSDVRYTPEQN
jgi:hypothetical protein